MCEHYIARAAEPFRLDELWPFTERLERFGLAGFGWGAAWLGATAGSPAIATSDPSATMRPGPRESVRRRRRRRSCTFDGRRACRRSSSKTPSPSTTRPVDSRSATTATFGTGAQLRAPIPRRRADPRPCGHRSRRPVARGCLDGRPIRTPAAGSPRAFRRTGEPRGPNGRRGRRLTTPATPTTRSSRSGLAGSASCRPASIRSTGRCSGSSHVARRAGADPARIQVTLDRNGLARRAS